MPLPSLPESVSAMSTPKYHVTLPINGQKIEYRPFTVKEQMVLLMALESEDSTEILKAINTCVNTCSDVTSDLSVCDMLFLFIKIRGKSAGEVVEPAYLCPGCQAPTDLSINLDNIKVEIPADHEHKIALTETSGIVMHDPYFKDVIEFGPEAVMLNTDIQLQFTSRCVETIWVDDEVYTAADYDIDSIHEFVLRLPTDKFNGIIKFFETAPYLEYKTQFDCQHCEYNEELVLRKLEDFFA